MKPLERDRVEIDRLDSEMAALFAQRMTVVRDVAARKQAEGLPIRDADREQAVLERNVGRIGDPDLRPGYAALLRHQMAVSRAYQEKLFSRADLCVHQADAVCPIYLKNGALRDAGRYLDLDRRVCIVTDDGTPSEYAAALAEHCAAPLIVTVPAGEGSKSVAVWADLLQRMQNAGLTRSDCVAAVGGGVVGDLAGFAAASYLRGIDCYQIPTTLLAMADASVGGKTALNLGGVKNAVGAFHQPQAVLIDTAALNTLSSRQLANGMAELLKMALTSDPALFALLRQPRPPLRDALLRALTVKLAVVEQDERETGLRRVLNFGHTLGHGIEAACGGSLLHGECVGLGMLPMCAPHLRPQVEAALAALGLPIRAEFDPEAALTAIAHDKKADAGGIQTVRVDEVGRWRFEPASLSDLRPMLNELLLNR